VFGWFKNRSRKRIRKQSVPEVWNEVTERGLWQYKYLEPHEQRAVTEYAAIVVAEKNWEGCDGFEMSDHVKWTIAGQMALVTLGLPDTGAGEEFFDAVLSVLVYPEEYRTKSVDTPGGGMVIEGEEVRLGEAWHRGPVILSWPDVRAAGRDRNRGRHLVAHEFAHQLDMLNGGDCDGVPPMQSDKQAQRWIAITDGEYQRLRYDCKHGNRTLLDCYGTEDKAEFFAVATEAFIQTPCQLAERHRKLFEAMCEYFGHDPRRWDEL
jgi:Mlc titration factor MtfA (ptsG expression regulator)